MTGAKQQPDRLLPDTPHPDTALRRLSDNLAARYAGVFSPQTVQRCVEESYLELAQTATVTTHLVTLAGRFATERLTALAQATGAVSKDVCEVLVVCVHNAGRSQIAAALLAVRGHGQVHVRSAGSAPTGMIQPAVTQVLAEIGVDLAGGFPKPLTDEVVRAADIVITMGCGDACPAHPGKRYLDWDLPDPDGQPLAQVRAIRDEIDARVQALLAELTPVPTGAG